MSKSAGTSKNSGSAVAAAAAASEPTHFSQVKSHSQNAATLLKHRIPLDAVRRLVRMLTTSNVNPIVLQVVAIKRFFCNPSFTEVTGLTRSDDCGSETYDLHLSDGQRYIKVLLDPAFNHVVNRGEIKNFSFVKISKGAFR